MSPEDYKNLVREVLDEQRYLFNFPKKNKEVKKQMMAVNVLVYFSLIIFLLTWIVAAYSWLVNGLFPEELVRYTSVLLGLSFSGYCCKTAYEYKVDKECESEIKKFP